MSIDLVIGRYAMKRETKFDGKLITNLSPFPLFVTNNELFLVEYYSIVFYQITNSCPAFM